MILNVLEDEINQGASGNHGNNKVSIFDIFFENIKEAISMIGPT